MIRNFWMLAAVALTLGLAQSPAIAQTGPPTSGNNAAVFFVPATVELVAGFNGSGGLGDGGLATAAQLSEPYGIAYDSKGNLYIADSGNDDVRKIDRATGNISTFAGTGTFGNTAPAANAQATTVGLGAVTGLAIDSHDNVYFADRQNNVVWKVDTTGVITIFAGTIGTAGYTGNTGLATSATLNNPYGLAFDASGNLYIADSANNVIRIVGTNGKINTFAGNGTGASVYGGCPTSIPTLGSPAPAATSVALCTVIGVAVDLSGNVYVSSYTYDQVYKVNTSGDISVFAGSGANYGGGGGETGDGGPATSAELWRPFGLYADPAGNVYISDQFGSYVREVTTAGIINHVYGDTGGGLSKSVIGKSDTVTENYGVGDASSIYFITMDADGNLVVPASTTVLSAGSTGNYFFGYNNALYTTATSTSLNAISSGFPPYLTITNPGGVTLNFTGTPTITGPFGIVAGGTCSFPGSVAPGESCTVIPSFTPTVDGPATGSMVIPSNANNAPQSITQNTTPLTISFSGSGVGVTPPPLFSLTPALMTFTSPTNVQSLQQLTLMNTGQVPFTIYSFGIQNGPNFAVSADTCPAAGSATTIGVGDTCTFDVTFTPSAPTSYQASVQVCVSSAVYSDFCNSGVDGNQVILEGTGTGTVSFTSPPLNFGDLVVGQTSEPLSATLNNGGTYALTIETISVIGADPADFAIATGANACVVGNIIDGGGLPASTCNIYVTFTPGSAASFAATLQVTLQDQYSAPPSTLTEQLALSGNGVVFASNVGTAEAAQMVTVDITTAGTLNSIKVLTQGAANLDFTGASGGSCATGTAYAAGDTCTVNVVFKPKFAGARNGAIILRDSAGNVLSTTYLPGTGNGPQVVFAPATQTSLLPASTYTAAGVAVDGSGNVYVTDTALGLAIELPKTPTGYGAPVTIANGLNEPLGIAVDGAGNVYIANYAGLSIVKVPWTGTAFGTQTNVPLDANEHQPKYLTVDSHGNIFFADYVHAGVREVPWNGAGYSAPVDIPFTNANSINGVAVDQNGDVFAADTYGHNVLELPWTGSGYGPEITIANGLEGGAGAPLNLVIDAANNLYISEQYTGNTGTFELVKVPYSGGAYGTPYVIPVKNLQAIEAVALDGLGNIYVADQASQQIYKLDVADPPTTTFANTNVDSISSDSPKTVTVTNIGNESLPLGAGANPTYPLDFPVNAADINLCAESASLASGLSCDISINFKPTTSGPLNENVVLTDNSLNVANATQDIPVSGTGVAIVVVNPTASLSPNPVPFGGQVYLATSGVQVATLTNTSTVSITGLSFSIVGTNPGDFAYSTTGTNGCTTTLAAGATCNIYLTFTPSAASSESATLEANFTGAAIPGAQTLLTGLGVAFSANVGSTEPAQPVTVYIAQAGTLTSIHVLTQGKSGLDFAQGATAGTCTANTTYAVGQSCTVNVTFAPQAPGSRPGSVLLIDPNGNVLGTTFLPGIAYGPQIVFNTGVQSTLPSYNNNGYQAPLGVTVDAALNVYVADTLNSRIIKIPWTGSGYGTPTNITAAGALSNPGGIAVDGNGNLFIADTKDNQIVEVPWNGSSYGTRVILDALGLPAPYGVTVDAIGNLFFSDSIDQKVVEMAWTGTGYGSPVTLTQATGLHAPHGLTTDSSLNLYIADSDDNQVVELPRTAGGFGTEVVLPASNLFYPQSIAVDAAGDVYIANTDAGTVVELPYNGSSYGTQFTLGFTGLQNSNGLAIDANGSLYVADGGLSDVAKLNLSGPPTLNFANTNVGSTSSDSPKNVALLNIGNLGAYLPIPSSGNNPVYPADFPINNNGSNLCEEDDTIDTGSSCTVSVNFTPTTSGPLSEYVVVTDQNANGTNITQSIPVNGNGESANTAQAINFPQPATPITYTPGLTFGVTATGGASGNPVVFSIDASSTATATISGSTVTVTGVGTIVIDANQAGNANYTAAPQVQRTVVVNPAAQAIIFPQPASPITYTPGLKFTVTATGGASGNAVVFSIDASSTATATVSGSTVTVTSGGSIVIDANQAGSSLYAAAAQVQRTVVVNPAGQVIIFTQPASPVTYAPGLTIALTATGGASGNPVVFTIDASSTGAGTISGSTLTVTLAGSIVVDANEAGNADYSAAPQVQRTVVVNPTTQTINFTQPNSPFAYASGLTIPLVATGGPSGNPVVFTIDASSTGAGTISGSTLTVTKVGNIVVDANQAGNADYSAAPQVQRTFIINPAQQVIVFTQPASPVTYNAGLTVALVATGGPSGNPVVFSIDASSTASGSISGSTLTVTSVGTFVIDANQAGNTDYTAATQVQKTILVNAPIAQAINFVQPTSPVTYAPSLTIALSATGGASGNPVTFSIDATSTATGTISGTTLTVTGVGSIVIDANQAGNATYSSAPQVQRTVVVNQAPQAINFTQPTSPVTFTSGLTITLTATGGASGNAVTFSIDASSTATGTVSANVVTVTGPGNLVIDANQAGNADYLPAPQVQETVLVNPPPPDFTIAGSPASQTIPSGGLANYTVTVASIGGFGNNVALTVTGLPAGATGTFTPPQLNPGDGTVTSMLAVQTTNNQLAQSTPNFWPLTTPALALLILLPFRRWRKVWSGRLMLLLAGLASLGAAAALTGCGGGFALKVSQSYTLTITGTSGADTHSTTVQLTVQ